MTIARSFFRQLFSCSGLSTRTWSGFIYFLSPYRLTWPFVWHCGTFNRALFIILEWCVYHWRGNELYGILWEIIFGVCRVFCALSMRSTENRYLEHERPAFWWITSIIYDRWLLRLVQACTENMYHLRHTHIVSEAWCHWLYDTYAHFTFGRCCEIILASSFENHSNDVDIQNYWTNSFHRIRARFAAIHNNSLFDRIFRLTVEPRLKIILLLADSTAAIIGSLFYYISLSLRPHVHLTITSVRCSCSQIHRQIFNKRKHEQQTAVIT